MTNNPHVIYNSIWNTAVDPVARKLLSFLSKPKGWKNGYGEPADKDVVRQALKVLQFFRQNDISRLEVFSGEGGQVLISAYHKDEDFDLFLNANNTFSYCLEAGEQDYNGEDLPIKSLNKILKGIITRWMNSRVFYTIPTTVLSVSALKAQPSKTPQEEAFQYLKLNVPYQHPAHYESTLKDITPKFHRNRQFTGKLTRSNFQRATA